MTAITDPTTNSNADAANIPWPRRATVIVWVVILFGAFLRLARWIHWRSLWLDEIYLANSFVHRSLHDLLFKPLDDWQAAPPGFLLLVHHFISMWGAGERAFRVTSLIFGLLSLPLMYAVARRVLRPGSAIVAIVLFAFLGPLIYYSNELKPYSCDVAVSLAITLATMRWMERPSTRRAIVAALAGAAGIFLSFPSVFVLAGAGVVLLWRQYISGNSPATRRGLAICLLWGLVFLCEYLIFVRRFANGEAHPHLVEYWIARYAFMPLWPISASLKWIFSCFEAIARAPDAMWLDYPDAAVIGLIVGIAVTLRRRDYLLILLAPLPFALLASGLKQYPFGDRLALFFVPQILLLIALAVETLWTNFAGKSAAVAIVGIILLPSASRAIDLLRYPPGREESLPAYRWTASQCQPGDVVYLTRFAEPSFRYYQSQSGWPVDLEKSGALHVQPLVENLAQMLDDVQTLAGQKRVWVVVIHADGGSFDVHTITLAAFNEIGRPLVEHSEPGAEVWLYDCSAMPASRQTRRWAASESKAPSPAIMQR